VLVGKVVRNTTRLQYSVSPNILLSAFCWRRYGRIISQIRSGRIAVLFYGTFQKWLSLCIRNHINAPFHDAVASLYDVSEAMNSALGEVLATHRDEGDTQRAVSPHVELLAWTESPIDSYRLYKRPVTSPCSRLGKLIVAKQLKKILKFLDHKYPLPSSQELATKRYKYEIHLSSCHSEY